MSAEPRFPGEDDIQQERRLKVVSSPDERAKTKKSRTRRALVPQAVRSNGRNTIVTAFLLIPFALVFILLLNIFVAGKQYDLVDLRAQEKTLTQENEAVAQEIEFYQAPQDLAIRADQLGLVASTFSASLNLQTGEVSGVPLAATKSEDSADPSSVVINPPALYDTDAFATASKRAEEQKAKQEEEKKKAEEEKKKAEEEKSASAQPSAESSSTAQSTAQPSASAQPTSQPSATGR